MTGLDVREPHERHAGHAPGAARMPLAALADGAGPPAGAWGRRAVLATRRSDSRSQQSAEPLPAGGVEAVGVIGGTRYRAVAGPPVVDADGGDGTVA
ncbi:rhodanese-like domain-containing protein [Streptomyces sp. CSDS2]|uniref:rhodanese-like domain-containing protein n=1 Tax=Streptomyces sp. CSDS2 TaxID=3055051 RepID=UPI0025B06C2B|nr:rhodanese-like domain-containing protein [Streptomyces sp. CSDS2]MDN3258235.1 rhodanese-like domain-containing protein [Streptomyces sp. CSDS2]